ncbi:ATP-NAD kinase family protein [Wansuia hejianensis]|uniref:ATP-NAD kinase family protein n=1 Tax=Wansuia hejianensis TaxID=2763667 RepID=A0A926EUV1_9FIRM|nr:ATP-NAD kinase family protein [Wansuia hejianensis]MBC8590268.1 ATP-NAD kinase family protein [Wansuia hejianensis]
MIKVGLIINPIAGVGGRAGLKGSDGEEILKKALERGGTLESGNKTKTALEELLELKDKVEFVTSYGAMGENIVKELGFIYELIGDNKEVTTAYDTENIAKKLKEEKVDILVFAGGDGTARNIYNAIGLSLPCVGIPAGVKIHSAVYANNPKSAGLAIKSFIDNPLDAQMVEREVMDIDEDLFRQNIVEAKLYGYLLAPHMENLMQNPKTSSKFGTHDIEGIADEIMQRMENKDDDVCYIFGTGGTTFKILEYMGLSGSLLGVDVIQNKKIVLSDASEKELYDFIKDKNQIVLVVTAIGGQGHIFGRGNQQLSPRVIRLVQKNNLWIVASADKIHGLENNALVVDTSDPELDKEIAGYKKVIVGWEREIVIKVKS